MYILTLLFIYATIIYANILTLNIIYNGPGYSYVAFLYGWHIFTFTFFQSVTFM